MGERTDSGPRGKRRWIDAAAKARFLSALRLGAPIALAAEAAGFSVKGFYGVRRREPAFRLGWLWALELSAADERAPSRDGGGEGGDGQVRIVPGRGRLLQRRKMRCVRFTPARQRIYLDHFAGTADSQAAAAAAGVSVATVDSHRRKHPEFAAAHDEALQYAYPKLEAEAVRQRLVAQERLREELVPTGEMATEFERVMKLLARWDRRDGRLGHREVRHGHLKRWTFEEAIVALDRKLRALGVRHGVAPGDSHS
ncbi:MAG TPA: hypothetical protein VMS43_07825 [Allosphingosinicella sp.]|nr:hypothetical protein [Allosphingosinicella sp.]